jgi:hydrogenase/urease accessory protein HupE
MSRVRAFGRFWWNFVVGDDWRAALGIVLAIGITAAIAAEKVAAWWFLPLAVAIVLAGSLRREARNSS